MRVLPRHQPVAAGHTTNAPRAYPGRVPVSVATTAEEKHARYSGDLSSITFGPAENGSPPRYPDPVETPANRFRLVPVAVVIFGIGLIALAAIFVLFLTGRHDLPVWLNASAGVLVPLGFGLALIGLVREARQTAKRNRRATGQSR